MFDRVPEDLERSAFTQTDETEETPRARLMRVLARHSALPFTVESVAAYETHKVKEAGSSLPWLYPIREGVADVVRTVLLVSLLVSFGGAVIGFFTSLLTVWVSVKFGQPMEWSPVVVTITLALEAYVIKSRGRIFVQFPIKERAFWEDSDINLSWSKLPLDARTLIYAIEGVVPEAQLFVRSLYQNQATLDPFLVVELDGERHFVAVWGEDYVPERVETTT